MKNYLLEGYAINRERLEEAHNKFNRLQQTINFLKNKSEAKRLKGREKKIKLELINQTCPECEKKIIEKI